MGNRISANDAIEILGLTGKVELNQRVRAAGLRVFGMTSRPMYDEAEIRALAATSNGEHVNNGSESSTEDDTVSFAALAEELGLSQDQLRRYCRQRGVEIIGETEATTLSGEDVESLATQLEGAEGGEDPQVDPITFIDE